MYEENPYAAPAGTDQPDRLPGTADPGAATDQSRSSRKRREVLAQGIQAAVL